LLQLDTDLFEPISDLLNPIPDLLNPIPDLSKPIPKVSAFLCCLSFLELVERAEKFRLKIFNDDVWCLRL
jgi:hypothetical protein